MSGLELAVKLFSRAKKDNAIIEWRLISECTDMAKKADRIKPRQLSGQYSPLSGLAGVIRGYNHVQQVEEHARGYLSSAKQLCDAFMNSFRDADFSAGLLSQSMGYEAIDYRMHRAWLRKYRQSGSIPMAYLAMLERADALKCLLPPPALERAGMRE